MVLGLLKHKSVMLHFACHGQKSPIFPGKMPFSPPKPPWLPPKRRHSLADWYMVQGLLKHMPVILHVCSIWEHAWVCVRGQEMSLTSHTDISHSICANSSCHPHMVKRALYFRGKCPFPRQNALDSRKRVVHPLLIGIWWLRLLGSLKVQVSFGKEPSKRDDILQKSRINLRS